MTGNDDVGVLYLYSAEDQASLVAQGAAENAVVLQDGAFLETHFMDWYLQEHGQTWTQVYPGVAFSVVYGLYAAEFEAHVLTTAKLAMMTDGSLRWLGDRNMRCCRVAKKNV